MSDHQPGPGWWQASDDKWYPPEQAPAPAQPTGYGPPPGYGYGPPPGYGPGYGYGPPPPGYAPATYYGRPVGPFGPMPDIRGARVGARAIDLVLVVGVGGLISAIAGIGLLSADTNDGSADFGDLGSSLVINLVIGLVVNLLAIAYEVGMVARFGATAGKLALGLRVVAADGSPPTLAVAARRHLPSIIGRLAMAVPLLGVFGSLGLFVLLIVNLVMVLGDGRSAYDRVGGTYVLRR